MSDGDRPNPDALLSSIQREEAAKKRGRLKVFLGMCPGVGKTFAMLEAAQRELKAGRDVVIGYVETHGRKETDALTQGLPTIPRRSVEYRGVTLTEMDLDAVLTRKPQVALVDELAHTNAPGSRHPKRYHDVQELLDAGIDVITTLNVQHVESRADTVRQITGAEIRETVPDSLLDDAVIELVDLPPAELVQRLHEGKVYVPHRAAAAAQSFFREGNLTALRELALRLVADHVGVDTREFRHTQTSAVPWKTGHCLLVAVGRGIAAVLPHMTARKAGHVINLSSIGGHQVYPAAAVYCGTKFAVRAISEGLRQETKDIRVTIISPGVVESELADTISDPITRDVMKQFRQVALKPDAIAWAMAYAIEQPADVEVNEIIVRPTAGAQ